MNKEILITEISRLTLKPGDILVCRFENVLTDEQAILISQTLKDLLEGAGHLETDVLLLHGGSTLEILEHAA